MRIFIHRVLIVLWAGLLAFVIALIGQGIWTALLISNLATNPSIPWAVPVMIVLLYLIWRYLKWQLVAAQHFRSAPAESQGQPGTSKGVRLGSSCGNLINYRLSRVLDCDGQDSEDARQCSS